MLVVSAIAGFMTFLYVLLQLSYCVTLRKRKLKADLLLDEALPTISICMAARDEETGIRESTQSLLKLNYPIEKLDIWIADDQSSDGTAEIVKELVEENAHLHYFYVEKSFERIRGKQNALAHIMRKSSSEFIAIVDADIIVQPTWLRELVSQADDETAMVCGVTTVRDEASLGSMVQNFDWVYLSTMLKVHADWGSPISGIGNNMLVRRSAYYETGGYEAMRFSILEDFLLFYEICVKRGHGYKHQMSAEVCNLSAPTESFGALLQQRIRWAMGSRKLPLKIHLAFALPAISGFLILVCIAVNWKVGLVLFAIRMLADSVVRWLSSKKIAQDTKLWFVPVWFFATLCTAAGTFYLLLFSKNLRWKGRKL